MSSAWAAVIIAGIAVLGSTADRLLVGGRAQGAQTEINRQLKEIVADHEQRLRDGGL